MDTTQQTGARPSAITTCEWKHRRAAASDLLTIKGNSLAADAHRKNLILTIWNPRDVKRDTYARSDLLNHP